MQQKFWNILVAGALATIAFDLFGQAISPMFGFAKLAPVGLANSTLNTIFGSVPKGSGHAMHVLTGLFLYPLGYLLVARPLQQKIIPALHWTVTAAVYGVGLWIFALYIVAHLITGNAPFLGWTGITWVALWGHVVFALVAAFILENKQPEMQALPA